MPPEQRTQTRGTRTERELAIVMPQRAFDLCASRPLTEERKCERTTTKMMQAQQPGSVNSSAPDTSQPGMLTSEASLTCGPVTCGDTHNVISSPVSVGGHTLFDSLDGQTIGRSGPARVHASHSATQENNEPTPTSGTSGRKCSGSSESRSLTLSLVNKLKARFVTVGSTEYVQTWKAKHTPLGRLYSAHTASARRTSDNGCGGWPSPAVQNCDGGPNPEGNTGERFTLQTAANLTGWPTPNLNERGPEHRESKDKRGSGGIDLQSTAQLAGWPTPQVCEGPNMSTMRENGRRAARITPQTVAALIPNGWATPTSRDHKDTGCLDNVPVNALLGRQAALASGPHQSSSPVETEKPGVLNPAFSLWLMGYPAEWASCGAQAMQSSRKSRRNSSARTSKARAGKCA
jgi:hypothetical protein